MNPTGKKEALDLLHYFEEIITLRNKEEVDISNSNKTIRHYQLIDLESYDNVDIPILQHRYDELSIVIKKPAPFELEHPKHSHLPTDLQKYISLPEDINAAIVILPGIPQSDEIDKFISYKWPQIKRKYFDELDKYKNRKIKFENEQRLFDDFFDIYLKVMNQNDEFELKLGIGLVNWDMDGNGHKIKNFLINSDLFIDLISRDGQTFLEINIDDAKGIKVNSSFLTSQNSLVNNNNIITQQSEFEASIKDFTIDKYFTEPNIKNAVEVFFSRIFSNYKIDNSDKFPSNYSTVPTLSLTPTLLLKKRETIGLRYRIREIRNKIGQDSLLNNLPVLYPFLLNNHPNAPITKYSNNIIYFPKPTNNEQLQILKQLNTSNHVCVQGPPGTGKSHAIANIIAHLLSDGKSIIVTAATKRALEVLQNLIPEPLRPLVICYLDNDKNSQNALRRNIETILSKIESITNEFDYNKQLIDLEKQLSDKLGKRQELADKIKSMLNTLNNQHIIKLNEAYSGTFDRLAQRLSAESTQFEFFTDFIEIDKIDNIIGIAEFLYSNRENYGAISKQNIGHLPELNAVPSSDDLRLYYEAKNTFTRNIEKYSSLIPVHKVDELINHLTGNINVVNQLSAYCKDVFALSNLTIDSLLRKNNLESAQNLFNSLKNNVNLSFPWHNLSININYSVKPENYVSALNDVLSYLEKGGKFGGFQYKVNRLFFKKSLIHSIDLIESLITADMFSKLSVAKIRSLINYFETIIKMHVIAKLLGIQLDITPLSFNLEWNKLVACIENEVIILKLKESEAEARQKINSLLNLRNFDFSKGDFEEIKSLLEFLQAEIVFKKYDPVFADIKSKLLNVRINDGFGKRMFDAIENRNYEIYTKCSLELNRLLEHKRFYEEYNLKINNLIKLAPSLTEKIVSSKIRQNEIVLLRAAILHMHAKKTIQNEFSKYSLIQSQEELKSLDATILKLTEQVIERKSWFRIYKKINQDKDILPNLKSWQSVISKLPKTGNSKRAPGLVRQANKYLEKCKLAIPCWIIPTFLLSDTLRPDENSFDQLIIDEASQLGPEALVFYLLAKKVLVVGDDKQTSPENVGIPLESYRLLIQRHLSKLPFNEMYSGEFSLFDHALRMSKNLIVLREHYRCMPEIIAFNNETFYKPVNKELYPLRLFSNNRLSPLKLIFCSNGKVNGNGSAIVNYPEAERIAQIVGNMVKSSGYQNKSIGIISLQGSSQFKVIQNLILKTIGPEKYQEHNIICSNSAGFQGDERDVIILSMVVAQNHKGRALTGKDDERRFNVAVSRAKDQLVLVHSIDFDDKKNYDDLRYKLYQHFLLIEQPIVLKKRVELINDTIPTPFESHFEVAVCNEIIGRGYDVIPQFSVGGGKYRIDLVVVLKSGKKLAVECDGEKYHTMDNYNNDLERQLTLERAGWQFVRIRGLDFFLDKNRALDPLWRKIEVMDKWNTGEHISEDAVFAQDGDNQMPSSITDDNYVDTKTKEQRPDIKVESFSHTSNSGNNPVNDSPSENLPTDQKDSDSSEELDLSENTPPRPQFNNPQVEINTVATAKKPIIILFFSNGRIHFSDDPESNLNTLKNKLQDKFHSKCIFTDETTEAEVSYRINQQGIKFSFKIPTDVGTEGKKDIFYPRNIWSVHQ